MKHTTSISEAPQVSIGLPVYNGEDFLIVALDSLLAQTFQDFEIIISDNGSTDKTEAICKAYQSRDQRIRYYRNDTNQGAAWNYNRVFGLSRAKYFKWASHDDVCSPNFLAACLDALESRPDAVLCHPKANIIGSDGKVKSVYTENIGIDSPYAHKRFYKLLETHGFYHGTQIFGLFKADILRKTKLIRPYAHSDRVLLAELSIYGGFLEISEFLFSRRIHPKISQIANPTDQQFSAWFDPNNKGKASLARFSRYSEYVSLVSKGQLSLIEKWLCYLQILRRLFISKGAHCRFSGLFLELGNGLFSRFSLQESTQRRTFSQP